MNSHLKREQCCSEEGCLCPAMYGSLCPRCFLAATPAGRAVELDVDTSHPLAQNWDTASCSPPYPSASQNADEPSTQAAIPDIFPPEWIK